MRTIKFRGKRVKYNKDWHKSEWKYGNLLNNDSIGEVGEGLESYSYAEVIPESVGQFTGLTDKNGVEIYEGDVVKQKRWTCQVEFISGAFKLKVINHKKRIRYHSFFNSMEEHGNKDKGIEVIGNIHQDKQP